MYLETTNRLNYPKLGIETVAGYSDADKDSLHAQLADVRCRVGTEDAFDSYLNRDVQRF